MTLERIMQYLQSIREMNERLEQKLVKDIEECRADDGVYSIAYITGVADQLLRTHIRKECLTDVLNLLKQVK